MNTSFHWRAYSSNLLGMGFAEIVRAHLKKDGVFAFNSTWSPDSIATASSTFKYTFQYRNFIFASDSSLEIPIATATMEALLGKIDWTTSGNFREEVDYSKTLAKIISSEPILNVTDVEQKSGRRLRVITEENMLTEFKYGRSLLSVE
ncbi:hypothetical protein BJP62_10510 [Jeongeupia sp. USM3]|nr:hypothetical protein BJP62_10510 [Jeongeupia sp. USM3]